MNCNFCAKTLDEFITDNRLTPEERQAVVKFAMYVERKRLEEKIKRTVGDHPPISEVRLIC